jgi:sodium-dependent phosphate cotransporter
MQASNTKQKLKLYLKVLSVFLLLYSFLVSIKLMGVSFNLFGKDFSEQLIKSCSNPFVGLFIGVLVTALLQSSSTTTSLLVGLVGGGILPIAYAIPIVMGANIGTTITNTLVSLTFVTRKEDFRRAFSGATVHDFFKICSVLVLFPLEMKFHFIEKTAFLLTRVFEGAGGVKFTSPLKLIIDPLARQVEFLLIKLFHLSDVNSGIIILIVALFVMAASLIYLVKNMRALIIGQAEVVIDRYMFKNDFTAFLLGLTFTVIVQSSSVTTSLIIPLLAAGIITLRKCFPYTLGASLGTTFTAVLASLATVGMVKGHANTIGVTAAFAHFSFNIMAIAILYPLKRIPLFCAKKLADFAAESKKWAFLFVLTVFFIIPLLVIFLSRYFR